MKLSGYISIAILALVWGTYYVANKVLVSGVSVFVVGVGIRCIVLLLLTIVLVKQNRFKDLFAMKPVLFRLILVGCIGFSLDITAFMGLRYSTAVNAAILLKTDALFANIITVIFLKEKIEKTDWFAFFIMLVGVLMVINIDFVDFKFNGIGDILLIMSAFFLALNAFVIKGIQHNKKVKVHNEIIAYYANFIILIVFGCITVFIGELNSITNIANSPKLLIALSIAGVTQTGIYLLYYYNLRHYPVWFVKSILLLMPCFGSIISFFVLDETLTGKQFAGMFIVIAGALLIILKQRRNLKERGV